MPTYDKVLELVEVLGLDTDNTIKKVTISVKTYDVSVGSSVFSKQPMIAVLSAADYANSSVTKVTTANTALDITLWGYEYTGGDQYYADNIQDFAESQVESLLQFQGTTSIDISTLS
jgi:hypothetical protein|tara:strand:+ start:1104 stop:1454 length:351 start_codon:yes stop_codon:yes gene_type:complete